MILREKISASELIENYNHHYPDRIKFCIDRKRKLISLDREMHIEMEHELYDDGSDYKDIFGGDILTEDDALQFVWESHPNIDRNRELRIGAGRKLTDTRMIEELTSILKQWII